MPLVHYFSEGRTLRELINDICIVLFLASVYFWHQRYKGIEPKTTIPALKGSQRVADGDYGAAGERKLKIPNSQRVNEPSQHLFL